MDLTEKFNQIKAKASALVDKFLAWPWYARYGIFFLIGLIAAIAVTSPASGQEKGGFWVEHNGIAVQFDDSKLRRVELVDGDYVYGAMAIVNRRLPDGKLEFVIAARYNVSHEYCKAGKKDAGVWITLPDGDQVVSVLQADDKGPGEKVWVFLCGQIGKVPAIDAGGKKKGAGLV